jgi:hypothetical protein
MLRRLRIWADEPEPEAGAAAEDDAERRLDCRHDVAGAALPISDRRVQSVFHLKNMSSRGACGISDIPLPVGAIIFVQLKRRHYHAAEVRWVRNALVGLRFFKPLDESYLTGLPRRRRPGPVARDSKPLRVFTRR